jgi:RimJ/RimL family protein N-acetyltransferase
MQGKLVRFRNYEKSDVDALVRWFSDEEVTQFLGPSRIPQTRAFQEQQIEEMTRSNSNSKVFVIETLEGEAIGECGLRNFDWVSHKAELIITIGDKRYWGKGYGSDAVSLVLKVAFERLNLHSVNLTTLATNERAIRCYEKCGFRREGRLRENSFAGGKYVDVVAMGILRADYEKHYEDESK